MIFDDATSEVYDVQLVDEESTATVMAALKRVVEGRGLFCSLYSDRGQSHGLDSEGRGGPWIVKSRRRSRGHWINWVLN